MSDRPENLPEHMGEPPAAFVAALRRLMRPLVRVMVAQGVTYPYLTRLLKALFVEVADQEFSIEGKPQTDSRLSLLTGVHRKDIRQFRGAPGDDTVRSPVVSLHGQMIALWMGHPRFRSDSGAPLPLAANCGSDGAASFEELVQSVSKDIRSRAVLDEWLRSGLARANEAGLIQLNVDAFIPKEGFDDLAYYFGQNLHDHIAAASHNLAGGEPAMLERSVYHENLTPQSVAALRSLAEKAAMTALLNLNEEALRRGEIDAGKPKATVRFNFGTYFFTDTDKRGSSDDGNGK